jgi:apolipoprotein N-acyltransferase
MIIVLATLLSGAMFYLSQGLDNLWVLAWLAPIPLLWLAYGKTPDWQLMTATAVSILAGSIYVIQCYRMLPPGVTVPAVALQAILFCVAVWFARLAYRVLTPLLALFAFPCCWTAFEFLSELASPNGTYGSFAYSQASEPLLIQTAALFGLYGITFLICLFANTIAMALLAQRRMLVAVGVGLVICAANPLFGFMRLTQPPGETVRVAAMVDESAMDRARHADTLRDAVNVANIYADAIRHTAAQGARFVVTPEGGIVFMATWRSAVLARLSAVSKKTGTHVIVGVVQRTPPSDLAFSFDPDGTVQRYEKRHLVRGLEAQFVPGQASGWLGSGRAMEVCKDMDFPNTIRRDAAKGIGLMGVPASDFGMDAWLHARMAVMRGVENGFALVRAANDGLVTASDAEGRLIVRESVATSGMTMIVADLPLGPGPTLYTRIGNAFALSMVFLFGGICGSLIAKVRGSRRSPGAGADFVSEAAAQLAARRPPGKRPRHADAIRASGAGGRRAG